MSGREPWPVDEEALRQEAAEWFARMRGPDREKIRLELERWRARGPRHRAAYDRMERTWALSAGLAGTAAARNRTLLRGRSPLRFGGSPAAFACIALIAVLLGGGAWLWQRARPAPPGVALALSSRVGEIRALQLADGTQVILDTDSAIRPMLSQGRRLVRLIRGRARFDVAHDQARPFLVEAGATTILARGTLFDVRFGREAVEVSLFRGAVDVRGAVGDGRPTRLLPGQSCREDAAGRQVAPVRQGSDRWVAGMLTFDGAPLAEVVAEANRYSEHKIRLASPELGALKVTGAFHALPAQRLAASLAAAFGLRVAQRGTDFALVRPD